MQRIRISVLTQVSVVHFLSHIYIMLIPALLPLLPSALGVSYVDLAVAVSLFGILSAVFQVPMGFIVDRVGAWQTLTVGIAVSTGSCFFLAVFPSYAGLLVASAMLGIANAVYHPSDYALLSRTIKESVMGKAFSLHSFSGYGGAAITPFLMVSIATVFSLSAAFFTAGLFGLATLSMIFLARPKETGEDVSALSGSSGQKNPGKSMAVFTLPVFVLTLLFLLLNLSTANLDRFSVSALITGYDVTLQLANTALTAFLLFSAIGVLCGGSLADRTRKHGYVAASAFGLAAVLTAVIALDVLPAVLLVPWYGVIGFLTGVIVPSRDMLVRAASPKGCEGRVFGIVSSGFNVAGTIGPPMCGFFLDNGLPSYIFWTTVLFMGLTVLLTVWQERKNV